MFDMLKKKIYPSHVSKHNLNREKQVYLLLISKEEKLRQGKSERRVAKSERRKAKS